MKFHTHTQRVEKIRLNEPNIPFRSVDGSVVIRPLSYSNQFRIPKHWIDTRNESYNATYNLVMIISNCKYFNLFANYFWNWYQCGTWSERSTCIRWPVNQFSRQSDNWIENTAPLNLIRVVDDVYYSAAFSLFNRRRRPSNVQCMYIVHTEFCILCVSEFSAVLPADSYLVYRLWNVSRELCDGFENNEGFSSVHKMALWRLWVQDCTHSLETIFFFSLFKVQKKNNNRLLRFLPNCRLSHGIKLMPKRCMDEFGTIILRSFTDFQCCTVYIILQIICWRSFPLSVSISIHHADISIWISHWFLLLNFHYYFPFRWSFEINEFWMKEKKRENVTFNSEASLPFWLWLY